MRHKPTHGIIALLSSIVIFSSFASAGDHSVFIYNFGHERGGWLGISIQDISPKLAKSKNLKDEAGAYVNNVKENSPADSAGIKEGDVITTFNGKEIDEADDLVRVVQKTKPGTAVAVELLRSGDKKTLHLIVGKYPRRFAQNRIQINPSMPRIQNFQMRETFGLRLHELDEQLGKYFEAPDGKGLLVEHVDEESSGEKAGFKAGDVIVKIGKESIEDMEDFDDAVEDVKSGDKVPVEVVRKGTRQMLTLVAGDDDSSFNFQFHDAPEALAVPDFDGECLQFEMKDMKGEFENLQNELRALEKKEITFPKEIERELHDSPERPIGDRII